MSLALKELIRTVRESKTTSEERTIIHRETASIRQALKEGKEHYRMRCMLKLLYIAMLGYHTEYSQMEIIRLLSQPEYTGKRIGYLTLSTVMDESHEVLTLAVNHIKKDIENPNPLIQSLALDVIANIAGEDMSRDALSEVIAHVNDANPYIKKKACLAAVRIVRKAPEHAETFLASCTQPFADLSHSAVQCTLTLINTCLYVRSAAEQYAVSLRPQVALASRLMKQLLLSTSHGDAEIAGITEPFLQLRVLEFLRLLGMNSESTAEAVGDALSQTLTNTEMTKNVGCSILYECVKTINAIPSDTSLRTLAVNTLGRFLASARENNLRFVALSQLANVVQTNAAAVQRHQLTVADCLKDPDLSIRKRAMSLITELVTPSNVRLLVPDFMAYLSTCEETIHADATARVAAVIEKKSPSAEWRVELSCRLLEAGMQNVPRDFMLRFIGFLSQQDPALQQHAVSALWKECGGPLDATMQKRVALVITTVWCLGELPPPPTMSHSDIAMSVAAVATNTVDSTTKQFALTALMKLCCRHAAVRPIAATVFEASAGSLDCELQQRAVEYLALLADEHDALARVCFAPMPPIAAAPRDDAAPPAALGGAAALAAGAKVGGAATIDDLFGGIESAAPADTGLEEIFAAAPSAPKAPPKRDVFRGADLTVAIAAKRDTTATGAIVADVFIQNTSSQTLGRIAFMVAVPKTCTTSMEPLATTVVEPGSAVVQRFRVLSHDGSPLTSLMMRARLQYAVQGVERVETFQHSQDV